MNKKQIIEKIRKILAGIDDSLEDDDKIAMVKGYWEVGQLAVAYKNSTGMLIREIAKEFEMPKGTLQRYMQFYKAFSDGYPEKCHDRVVKWSYICGVLPVRDKKARHFYLEEACRYGWNKYDLAKRIRSDYYGISQDSLTTDKRKNLKSKKQRLYTYASEVIKVVDGDTQDLEIDVGFKLNQEHRVRLRGINCPEVGTPEGRKAKRFVEKEMNKCIVEKPLFKGRYANRPLVVVKTFKQGMFGRYIVDLYYLPGETDPEIVAQSGKLLNQVLINKGLARRV